MNMGDDELKTLLFLIYSWVVMEAEVLEITLTTSFISWAPFPFQLKRMQLKGN